MKTVNEYLQAADDQLLRQSIASLAGRHALEAVKELHEGLESGSKAETRDQRLQLSVAGVTHALLAQTISTIGETNALLRALLAAVTDDGDPGAVTVECGPGDLGGLFAFLDSVEKIFSVDQDGKTEETTGTQASKG